MAYNKTIIKRTIKIGQLFILFDRIQPRTFEFAKQNKPEEHKPKKYSLRPRTVPL